MPEAPILVIRRLSKGFPGVRALAGVDFFLRRGEIHALMGENGAGKSTLIKVLTGVYPRDDGEILFEGRPFAAGSPHEAQDQGISTVYQEVNLVPNLSVAENLLLGRQPTRGGLIDGREMRRRAEAILERLNLHVDVNQLLGDYSIAVQQMVAIGRALEFESKILILDEPTSSLDAGEVEQLFKVMRKLKAEGHAILFVTHFVDQVYAVSDRITVLRNGELGGEFRPSRLPKVELISKLLGKALHDLESVAMAKSETASERAGEPVLRVQGLGKAGVLERFDLEIHAGEVLGLAGLLGSGRTELATRIFGIEKRAQGGDAGRGGEGRRQGGDPEAHPLPERKGDGGPLHLLGAGRGSSLRRPDRHPPRQGHGREAQRRPGGRADHHANHRAHRQGRGGAPMMPRLRRLTS